MRYRPQFQHKTGRLLRFTTVADGGKNAGGVGGPVVQNLSFLWAMLTATGRRGTGVRVLRACD